MPPAQQSAFSTDFDVKIGGSDIEDGDVLSFIVERDLNQPDMAVLTLRNDADKHTLARRPGEEVEVKAGGANEGAPKAVLFKGEIVGIEPSYKAQGESKVIIRCFNKMHRMHRGKKSKTYQKMTDKDVVSSLVGTYGLTAEAGSSPSIKYDHLYQHNQSDLEFVRVRAARLGFSVWCEDTKLYFDAPKLDVDSGIELKIDEASEHHLKSFHVRLSTSNVLSKVTVRGWDPTKKKEIVGDAAPTSTPLGGKTAAAGAGDLGKAETFRVDHPIFSIDEAKAIAKAMLSENNLSYITGEAECRGHGAYKPAIVVKITCDSTNADNRFNGKYLVTGVTHRYTHGSSGGQGGGFVSILRLARDGEK
jgi:phage protein D